MFVQAGNALDSYSSCLLHTFCARPQARASDLAQKIPSAELHCRALDGALMHTREGFAYVLDALNRWDDEEWPLVEATVGRELSAATMFLGGALDGIVILEQGMAGKDIDANTSFERTQCTDMAVRALQNDAKKLRSMLDCGQPLYADIWSLVNFWKHYFPHQPRPTEFVKSGGIRDFSVAIGEGYNSGPVMQDLLVPTFNLACRILKILAERLQEPLNVRELIIS